ncbi:hypothetical protein Tco_0611510 [Tanacetum coccineum]
MKKNCTDKGCKKKPSIRFLGSNRSILMLSARKSLIAVTLKDDIHGPVMQAQPSQPFEFILKETCLSCHRWIKHAIYCLTHSVIHCVIRRLFHYGRWNTARAYIKQAIGSISKMAMEMEDSPVHAQDGNKLLDDWRGLVWLNDLKKAS